MDAEGRLDHVDGRWQLTYVRALAHPPEKVWRALTEEHGWFPTTIEGELSEGSSLRFSFPPVHAIEPMHGEVIACDPPHRLEFSWGEEDTLHFELEPDGDGTLLTFRNRFDTLGKASRDATGWQICLDGLGSQLSGEPASGQTPEHNAELEAAYRERFGPEASTAGLPDGYMEGEAAG